MTHLRRDIRISQLCICVACYMDHRYVWTAQLTLDNVSVDEFFHTSHNVFLVCIGDSRPAVPQLAEAFLCSWIPPGNIHSASESQ